MSADSHLMLAFEGTELPPWLRRWLSEAPPAGLTIFRELNLSSPGQTAELTSSLQQASSAPDPLLIAIDQEGGQLLGLVGSTPFAGNMALGAAADPDLTRRVSAAMGRELAAVGVNLNYAPVADIATRPRNPSLGVRSFGGDPVAVATHVRAAVEGYRSSGVMCTLKHFPGKGEATVDPHYELPRIDLDLTRLRQVELRPFVEGIAAGADVVMTGHYGIPAITGEDDLPVSMSERAVEGLLRREMGFGGLVITDALDMGALDQGASQVVDIIATMRGGTDLLLCTADDALIERSRLALVRGAARGLIPAATLDASGARLRDRRASTTTARLDPDLVGSHRDLAAELAAKSVTLVRDDAGLLPLDRNLHERVLVVEPEPTNVTPADTSALYEPLLASAIQTRHGDVTGIVYPHDPQHGDISSIALRADDHDLVVVGTVNATDGQAALVRALHEKGKPMVSVAVREPQDLASYPDVTAHICSYSGHLPSMEAVAAAMFGVAPFPGRLPVAIPGLYPIGHGLGT